MHEKSLLHKAMNTSVGDLVTVHVASNPEVEAVVKYRGPLKDCVGIFFGVQLQVTWFTVCITKLYKVTTSIITPYMNSIINVICDQLYQNPPHMHTMAKNSFHHQSVAPSIN